MRNTIFGLTFLGLLLLTPQLQATEKIGLAKFIEYGINNKNSTENSQINNTFRQAVESFRQDKYGFKLNYDFSQDIVGGANVKNSKLGLNKTIPFFFGSDLSIKIDQALNRGDVLPNKLVPESLALNMNFDVPLTLESYKQNEFKLHEKERTFELAKLTYIESVEKNIQNLIESYVNYLDSLNRFESEKNQYEIQKKLYSTVKAKYDLGQVSGFEVIKARVSMIQSESSYKNNQLAFEESKRQIYLTLGLSTDADVKFSSDIDFDFKIGKIDFYLSRLRYNKDIQRAIRELEEQQLNYEGSLNTFLKNITFNLSKSYSNSGNNDDSNTFTASTSFTIPLIDGGDSQIAFQSARDSYTDSQSQFIERVRNAHDKIVSDYNSYIRLKESKATLQLFEKYANEEYKISLDRYSSGTATLEEVKNALNNVQSVRNQIFENRKNQIIAGFQLLTDSGLFFNTEDYVVIK